MIFGRCAERVKRLDASERFEGWAVANEALDAGRDADLTNEPGVTR